MPTQILQISGQQFVFADHALAFAPTAVNDLRQGTPTNVQMINSGTADDTARQSAKFDFGATRAAEYSLSVALEFAATPTAGERVDFFIAPSSDSTAANANPGGVAGADSAYAGYSANLDAALLQLVYVGSLIVTTQITTTVQIGVDIGRYAPAERYGTLILVNRSAATLHVDAVENHLILTPIIDEAQ